MSKETILDILKEMREPLPEFDLNNEDVDRLLRFYANRIEDAAGRLVEETRSAVNAEWHESLGVELEKSKLAIIQLEHTFATKGDYAKEEKKGETK